MKLLEELSHDEQDSDDEGQFVVEGFLVDYPGIEQDDVL